VLFCDTGMYGKDISAAGGFISRKENILLLYRISDTINKSPILEIYKKLKTVLVITP
jgi:hypothetical protein